MFLKEACYKVESYIYHIKNNFVCDEETVNIVSIEDWFMRVRKLFNDVQYFIYSNNYDSDKVIFE